MDTHCNNRKSFKTSEASYLKTIAAVILLFPGLLLSVLKLAAYISSDVREKHQYIKNYITPINNIEIGTRDNPIKNEEELAGQVNTAKAVNKAKAVNAVIIHGDGNLNINKEAGILGFNPKKLILEGAEIVHQPSDVPRLDNKMLRQGNWKIPFVRMATAEKPDNADAKGKEVKTVKDALKAPLERKGMWPSLEFYNSIFSVPRPETVRA